MAEGQSVQDPRGIPDPPECATHFSQHAGVSIIAIPTVSRPPRLRLDEVPLHMVQRGHNRSPCFFHERDYLVYLHCLALAAEKTQCSLQAYVLMTNHVHLLLTPAHADS